jgi:hemerythrin
MEMTAPHSGTFTFGLPSIDAAHDELRAALIRQATLPDQAFGPGFPKLLALIEGGFRREEDLMEAIGYAQLRSHREEHARVLAALHQTELHVAGGDIATGRQALSLLGQWFSVHEACADFTLGVALQHTHCDQ